MITDLAKLQKLAAKLRTDRDQAAGALQVAAQQLTELCGTNDPKQVATKVRQLRQQAAKAQAKADAAVAKLQQDFGTYL